jgi:hypothetical protein
MLTPFHRGYRFGGRSTLDVCMGLSVEHLPKPRREYVRQAGFGKKRGEAVTLGTFAQRSFSVTTDGNDGDVSRPAVLL